MYCPQCSQPQPSNDVRFCVRCGFHLAVVSELLSSNGIRQRYESRPESKPAMFRRKDAPVGAKLMFFGVVAVPLSILLAIIIDSPGPFILPFLLFLIGLTQVVYLWLFGARNKVDWQPQQPTVWGTTNSPANLPYAEPPRAQLEERRRLDTSEFAQPASVTEHTTKLLNTKTDDQSTYSRNR